ncbi:hypothetical protein DdX_09728 [Ditylenchus destructor]|uniref:Uncharacterized protein n=1 Tax=Ditylenchus destructor TaxID=166010 RepID=A0AAD4QZT8_9BILA|nr:hypothetical protein DdX_09728 [Ditylenchus destructor]
MGSATTESEHSSTSISPSIQPVPHKGLSTEAYVLMITSLILMLSLIVYLLIYARRLAHMSRQNNSWHNKSIAIYSTSLPNQNNAPTAAGNGTGIVAGVKMVEIGTLPSPEKKQPLAEGTIV